MDSRVTKALAGLFLLGAVGAAYFGVRMTHEPRAQSQATHAADGHSPVEAIELTQVVVAKRDLQPHTALTLQDLALEAVKTPVPGNFSTVEQVVGQQLWLSHRAGEQLSAQDIESSGALARMIRPGERAMAVAVDEVVGAGGFLQPGDYVDVLLVMQEAGAGGERSAQIALPAVRLLSYGDALGLAVNEATGIAENISPVVTTPAQARTAVLAVPEQWAPRLILASQAGVLRLAVRSAEERLMGRYRDGELMPVPLSDDTRALLLLSQLGAGKPEMPTAPEPPREIPPAQTKTGGIEILRGAERTLQDPR